MSSADNRSDSGERVIQIRRCACVVKGGRRFSFAALVVTGDSNGRVGYGYGKAIEVPLAVEKATKQSNRPHQVLGTYRASRVLLLPAKPGTGVIAGHCVRSVVEAAGITDILTKAYGSTNPLNLVKATLDALKKLRTREQIERLRGVSL
mgnify:CR=1 FL=1